MQEEGSREQREKEIIEIKETKDSNKKGACWTCGQNYILSQHIEDEPILTKLVIQEQEDMVIEAMDKRAIVKHCIWQTVEGAMQLQDGESSNQALTIQNQL